MGSRFFGNFDWTVSDVTKCSWWYFERTFFFKYHHVEEGAWKVRIQTDNWPNKLDNTAYKEWIWSGFLLKYHCFFQRHCCIPRKYLTTFRATPQKYSWREWSAAFFLIARMSTWSNASLIRKHMPFSVFDGRLARWKSILKYHAKRKQSLTTVFESSVRYLDDTRDFKFSLFFPSYVLLDCKTVRIFAYSSKREQSNERSGTRLNTESETGERR